MAGFIYNLVQGPWSLGYQFADATRLEKALTAPGFEGKEDGNPEERDQYEGCRTLAKTGGPVLDHVILNRVLAEGASRQKTHELIKSTLPQMEERAKIIGFYDIIKLNPRQRGVVNPKTLRLVFFAILGAVWEDCGKDDSIITPVVERLYLVDITPGIELEYQVAAEDHTTSSENLGDTGSSIATEWPTELMVQHETEPSLPMQLDPPTGFEFEGFTDIHDPMDYSISNPTDEFDLDIDSFSHSYAEPLCEPATSYEQNGTVSLSMIQMRTDIGEGMTVSLTGFDYTEITESSPSPTAASGSKVDTGKSGSTRKTSSSVSVLKSKKQKSAAIRVRGQDISSLSTETYIQLERKRCHDRGLVFRDYDMPLSSGETNAATLTTLYFGIGSPEILTILQELLRMRRSRSDNPTERAKHNLSISERMKAIQNEDEKMAYGSFRKRCHIYQLFVECNSEISKTTDGFVNSTTKSMARKGTSQKGNPHNKELSRVSTKILSQSYPDIKQDDHDYKIKERYAKNIRRLGQRLNVFVETFHYGILGLIPLPCNEPTHLKALKVSDDAILNIPENDFKAFVDRLATVHGPYLREASKAVTKVVAAIFNEEMDLSERFPIERCEQARLVQYPRGLELLQLIS